MRMHKLTLLIGLALFAWSLALARPTATSLTGSWQRTIQQDGEDVHEVLLFTDHYFSWTAYRTGDSEFVMTKGGSWARNGDEITFTYEFHTADPSLVGTAETHAMSLVANGRSLQLPADTPTPWIDHRTSDAELSGAWLFAGRKRDGEISRRDTDQSRKTMKILTGGWFQWIAYDTADGRFSGTGGGSYTAENGKYVEQIKFFSRDKTRVGAELGFDFDLQDGEWHHSGLNSRGEPMYEIWAPRD